MKASAWRQWCTAVMCTKTNTAKISQSTIFTVENLSTKKVKIVLLKILAPYGKLLSGKLERFTSPVTESLHTSVNMLWWDGL